MSNKYSDMTNGVLHLCFDGNFIENSYRLFERYYPKRNFFIVDAKKENIKLINNVDNFRALPFSHQNYGKISDICANINVSIIVIHGISSTYVDLLKHLRQLFSFKVYWIFWGFELYNALGERGLYRLDDERRNPFKITTYLYPNKYNVLLRNILHKPLRSKTLDAIISHIDYFCFWNHYDFELLQHYYKTNIKYKYFTYSAHFVESENTCCNIQPKRAKTILINHQASLTGNHISIMRSLNIIDKTNEYEKIMPLSYGSYYIRNMVIRKGKNFFGNKFVPILNYMNRDDYFNLINNVEVAVFGARRQEAAGNIHNLLRNGVKVFLREDNNLLKYYKEKGYIVFSYEMDLKTINDLHPLSHEQQQYNYNVAQTTKIYYDNFMPTLFD